MTFVGAKQTKKPYLFLGKVFAFAVLLVGVLFSSVITAMGAQKSYSYDFIDITLSVNKDTTVDVTERQRFNFNGEFHKGWRSVSLRKIDSITDISVVDAKTNIPLKYTSKRLDKTDPESWGKYTYRKENGTVNIEWYYDAKNEKRDWLIKYKVHGAVAFYDDFDELYWNLLTDYDVPISKVVATVVLPQSMRSSDEMRSTFYSSVTNDASQNIISYRMSRNAFYYSAQNIRPGQDLTIALGWPKGVVDQSAYWRDFAGTYWGYLLGAIIAILSFFAAVIFWYFTERRNTGRGTIIPRYTPPENLPPAMAEVLVYERISEKTWPATLVDLAVRGHVTIKEDKPTYLMKIIIIIYTLFLIAILLFSFINLFLNPRPTMFIFVFIMVSVFFFNIYKNGGVKNTLSPKDYIIKRNTKKDYSDLEDYEKKFLDIVFCGGNNIFSTKKMKLSSGTIKQKFSEGIRKLKKDLYKEVESDTDTYEKLISKDNRWRKFIVFVLFAVFISFIFIPNKFLDFADNQLYVAVAILILSLLTLLLFVKYEARLNKRGQILREDWLGFKMYLETAEKYRMQNLTPEIFEKYLPYAMIFGVEKKWAKAFESLNMQSPTWYHSRTGSFGSSTGSFAPGAFAASLSYSFASSMSSAGGGASGGGGVAGGGAGGGGGGAS